MATSSCEALPFGGSGLIEDEKFDFDVPVSPTDCDVREISNDLEDEDEVFFGPVGHKERCVTLNSQDDDNFKPMSPLNGEQIAELFKEATAVSIFIKNSSLTQSLGNDDMIDQRENKEICKILSKTFSVTEDQENMTTKPDQEDDIRIAKSASSPESVDSLSDDVVIPTTPRRILQESNSQNAVFQSPFKGRKARPLQNVSKFTKSKLPKTQMTLKTRSCFNSPIKVEHLYGIKQCSNVRGSSKGDSSFAESSKLPLPSQSGIRPPGFGVQPRRRRTSSSSSVSSTSSTLSYQSNDLNETFTISKGSSSDIPSIPPAVCARKVPATKASLKPVNGTSTLSKPTFTKPKGRPQPVKALAQPGINSKKAPPTPNDSLKSSKVLGSTPGRRQSGTSTEQGCGRPQTPSNVDRSKSFTTPVGATGKRSSISTRPQTPSNVQRSKSFTTPVRPSSATAKRSSISTGQPVKSAQTPSRARKPEVPLTPRRRGSVTPRDSSTTVPTPVRRRSSAAVANGTANKTGPVNRKNVVRPATPDQVSCVSSDTVTPPNPVPSKVVKRKSLSASGQKRRSLLPTPLGSRITRSQSQRSRPTSVNCEVKGALPFSISPSAEVKPRSAAIASESQADLGLEASLSHSRMSDPFSPASQSVTVDPVEDYSDRDSVVRNLIELSPTPTEGNLIDI
ncbi:uncharacterized protein LOC144667395 [Oculina patagonica]